MRISYTGTNVEVTDALKSYAEKRLQHLTHYFANLREAHVAVTTQRNWQIVEVQLDADGRLIRAEERTPDAYASIDAVVDKLQKQIKRFKGKLIHRPRSPEEAALKPATMMVEPAAEEDQEEEEEAASETPEGEAEDHPRLVRTKRFAVKPMNAEEAALQMELLHHNFFVFLNAETGQVNVVYQRRDGDYGLIEPEF